MEMGGGWKRVVGKELEKTGETMYLSFSNAWPGMATSNLELQIRSDYG